VDGGITFFDNCWEYHRGKTEVWMGDGLQGLRDRVFLMTKVCTHGRDKSVAMRQLEESLTRLQSAIPRVHRTQRPFHSLANAFAQRSVRHGATKI
jgi:aryl-alcohol dehydrogenase-like predicted oxidoreductase